MPSLEAEQIKWLECTGWQPVTESFWNQSVRQLWLNLALFGYFATDWHRQHHYWRWFFNQLAEIKPWNYISEVCEHQYRSERRRYIRSRFWKIKTPAIIRSGLLWLPVLPSCIKKCFAKSLITVYPWCEVNYRRGKKWWASQWTQQSQGVILRAHLRR